MVSQDLNQAQNQELAALEATQEIAKLPQTSLRQMQAVIDEVKQVIRERMQLGKHYAYPYKGAKELTLLQDGAEALCNYFRLYPDPEMKRIDHPNGHREYEFKTYLKNSVTNETWGVGVGCCSTLETKYRYRNIKSKCPKCGKETIQKSEQYNNYWCNKFKDGCGANFPLDSPQIQPPRRVENEDPADNYNTVMRMASKRSLVDAVHKSLPVKDGLDLVKGGSGNGKSGSGSPGGNNNQSSGQQPTQPGPPPPDPPGDIAGNADERIILLRKYANHRLIQYYSAKGNLMNYLQAEPTPELTEKWIKALSTYLKNVAGWKQYILEKCIPELNRSTDGEYITNQLLALHCDSGELLHLTIKEAPELANKFEIAIRYAHFLKKVFSSGLVNQQAMVAAVNDIGMFAIWDDNLLKKNSKEMLQLAEKAVAAIRKKAPLIKEEL